MIFGGLAEKEVEEISKILNEANIEFKVSTDENIQNFNKKSMNNDLRHFGSTSISTHILSIELDNKAMEKLDEQTKAKLLKFGITDEVPEGFEIDESTIHDDQQSNVHHEILKGNRQMVGKSLLVQIVIILGFALIVGVIKYIYS